MRVPLQASSPQTPSSSHPGQASKPVNLLQPRALPQMPDVAKTMPRVLIQPSLVKSEGPANDLDQWLEKLGFGDGCTVSTIPVSSKLGFDPVCTVSSHESWCDNRAFSSPKPLPLVPPGGCYHLQPCWQHASIIRDTAAELEIWRVKDSKILEHPVSIVLLAHAAFILGMVNLGKPWIKRAKNPAFDFGKKKTNTQTNE